MNRRRGRPGGSQGAELLAVARGIFLEHGFAKATMDAVAAEARISKASLYQQHPGKDALYAAVVLDWAAAGRDAMRPHLDLLLAAEDLRAGLAELARTVQAAVLSPDVLRMRRLVAAESARHPDVAARYVAESWDRNIAALAEAFAALARRGCLRAENPLVAAQQFTWLVVGVPLNEQTLRDARPGPAELEVIAESAVDTFLARYAPVDS